MPRRGLEDGTVSQPVEGAGKGPRAGDDGVGAEGRGGVSRSDGHIQGSVGGSERDRAGDIELVIAAASGGAVQIDVEGGAGIEGFSAGVQNGGTGGTIRLARREDAAIGDGAVNGAACRPPRVAPLLTETALAEAIEPLTSRVPAADRRGAGIGIGAGQDPGTPAVFSDRSHGRADDAGDRAGRGAAERQGVPPPMVPAFEMVMLPLVVTMLLALPRVIKPA